MDYGNMLVNAHEADTSWHSAGKKCRRCNGTGGIPWRDVEDGLVMMQDEIQMRMATYSRHGYPIKNYRQMLAIGRAVRHGGCECPECRGDGEIYG